VIGRGAVVTAFGVDELTSCSERLGVSLEQFELSLQVAIDEG
jgi:hypothetical protein